MGKLTGQPNHFIEKIWSGLNSNGISSITEYGSYTEEYKNRFQADLSEYNQLMIYSKNHTIREDSSERWRAGMDIHFVINNRTKNRFQFAPVVKCVSVQEIEIKDVTSTSYPNDFSTKIHLTVSRGEWTATFTQAFSVKVDGVQLSHDKVSQLAINDGFNSFEDFFKYFNKDFKGKIIHWTDLKY